MPSRPADSTAVPSVPVDKRRRPGARAIIVHPPELATAVALTEGELVLGRGGEAGFAVAHPTLSRRHLVIRWERNAHAYTVADLGSKNGSSLNGAPLVTTPHIVGDGAVLRAGKVLLVFEASAQPPAPAAPPALVEAIPGDAAATRVLRSQVVRAGADPSHVLLIGETGTGKEHVARAVHRLSGRRGPFVAVSCAEMSSELMAGQLFGHARGAFTGAHRAHPGLFRAAEGGTLLLDEIGELAADLQPKLLRVLQEGEVLPLGERRPVPVDVRVIAATNADVPALVDKGAFRRDLYARLAFWEIVVPPLRARRADILGWIPRLHHKLMALRAGDTPPLALDTDAAEAILLGPWLDNLRGLDRMVHRLAADHATGEVVTRDEVVRLAGVAEPSPARSPTPSREELAAMLAKHLTVSALARHYGRDRRQIYRWLKAMGIR